MKPYAHDLRRALVGAYANHDYSQQAVADLFGGSPATGRNLVRRKREPGTPDAKPRGGGNPAILHQLAGNRGRPLLEKRHDRTLAEFCEQRAQESPTRVSVPTMGRVVRRLGWRRKKDASRHRT